jgi:hypothetical protein
VKNVIKFLGIQVDDKLIWDKHVQFIIKKLNSAHFALLNLRKSVGLKLLIQFYHACIKTHLEYGIILWGRGRDVTSVLILQKKIIRLIKNAPYDAHCRPLQMEVIVLAHTRGIKMNYAYRNTHLLCLREIFIIHRSKYIINYQMK